MSGRISINILPEMTGKNMKNYDLPINTTRLGLDETAELIKEYVKLRGYMK